MLDLFCKDCTLLTSCGEETAIDRHEYGRNDRRELHTQIRLSRP
jgi:hypothetical protein